jgi:hypothetical protein
VTVQSVRDGRRGSRTLVAAVVNVTLSAIAWVALFAAGGSNLSTDVHDGGVIFMVWTVVLSPIVSLITFGLGMAELQSPNPHRTRCWIGIGATGALLLVSVGIWVVFRSHTG